MRFCEPRIIKGNEIESDQEGIFNQFLMDELTSNSPVPLPTTSAVSRLEDQHE